MKHMRRKGFMLFAMGSIPVPCSRKEPIALQWVPDFFLEPQRLKQIQMNHL